MEGRGPAMESLGTGVGRGKASSCPSCTFAPILPLCVPVPSDSIAGPPKKGKKSPLASFPPARLFLPFYFFTFLPLKKGGEKFGS